MKIMTLAALLSVALLVAGCGDDERTSYVTQHPGSWEFQIELPSTTTAEELIALEKNLRKEGYSRIDFTRRYSDSWTPMYLGVKVSATRTLPPLENQTTNNPTEKGQ